MKLRQAKKICAAYGAVPFAGFRPLDAPLLLDREPLALLPRHRVAQAATLVNRRLRRQWKRHVLPGLPRLWGAPLGKVTATELAPGKVRGDLAMSVRIATYAGV